MRLHRHLHAMVRGAAVVLLLVLSPLVPVADPSGSPMALAADGAFVTGATSYTVEPDRRRVHARVELRIKNTTPNRVSGNVTTQIYYAEWGIGVQDEATNVRVTRGGSRLRASVKQEEGYKLVRFDLGPNLFYGQTAPIRVDYDLPDGGARSESPIRVGSAFTTFYAYAHGDDRASVRIVFPVGYEITTRGDDVQTTSDAIATVLTTPGSVDAGKWFVVVTADRPAGLKVDTLEVPIGGEDRLVEIRAWPEDDVWSGKVHDLLLRGYPELEIFSFHLDSVFCHAAHASGAPEVVLPEPMRIYHIEHGTGSGWTPEGQRALFARLAAADIPWLSDADLRGWAAQMRRLRAPLIFNRGGWGLEGESLDESYLT